MSSTAPRPIQKDQVLNALSMTAFIIDTQTQSLVWMNDFAVKRFGFSIEELQKLGDQYLLSIIHPDDKVYIEAFFKKVSNLEDGKVIFPDFRLRDKAGQYHWFQYRIAVHSRNDKGEVVSIAGTGTDATEAKAYEQKLKTSIEKLSFSLSAANLATWEWDLENDRVIWDDLMYALHGASPQDNIRVFDQVALVTIPEDLKATQIKVEEAMLVKKDFQVSYRVRRASGEIRHIRCYGKFIKDHPTMYGVAQDYTDELETEQEVAEAKAKMIASAKMAALGEMSGGIAHEINNPLTVIQARAFQLNQMVDANKFEGEKLRTVAESISRTADKIAKIIKSLLSFAREGSQDSYELVQIHQTLEETLEFCKTRFRSHGVDIQILPFDQDLEIECQIVQIEQVLLNLLNNSFDAVQNLNEKWIQVQVDDLETDIEIRITDSGLGINKELAEKIMLPFFTTKEVGKGTGLGLSISTGIIKAHKGQLSLDSKSKNTSFVIRLPKWQTPPE